MSCDAAAAEPLIWRVWRGAGRLARLVRALLTPFSWVYGLVVGIRSSLYERGWLEATAVEVPVVGVGNLSVGGTGKTPFVIWLADSLRSRGRRVVVVARGVGAKRPALITCGTDLPDEKRVDRFDAGEAELHVPPHVPDEALLVALRARVPVVTGVDRVAACRMAVRLFSPDLILLDDGFQHRRLARNLDIVLLAGGERQARLLPAGPLREPPAALERADVIVDEAGAVAEPAIIKQPTAIVRWPGGEPLPLENLSGKRVFAFAGIARPWSFLESLAACGAECTGFRRFKDHHRYSTGDWKDLAAAAAGCDWIVTTEKDLVKVRWLAGGDPRLVALRIDVAVERGEEILERICRFDAPAVGNHDR